MNRRIVLEKVNDIGEILTSIATEKYMMFWEKNNVDDRNGMLPFVINIYLFLKQKSPLFKKMYSIKRVKLYTTSLLTKIVSNKDI